jgi:predicted AlkP superfamily pyrophosphatase or phosphodiesterase
MQLRSLVGALLLTGAAAAPAAAQTPPKPLTIVFVVDGLRPDSINPTDTPNIYRLAQEGTRFSNSHSVVPTVTRGNATAIGSGAYPARSGILGNAMYWPAVNPTGSFSTGDANQLTKLDEVTGGKMVLVQTLGERLQAAGLKVLSLGSGTSGATLLLNPRAPKGVGQMVNTGDSGAPFAYPAALGDEIKARFGEPPSTSGQPNANVRVTYAEKVLREGLLTADGPDVVLNWITEPDGSQHSAGVGSEPALSGIRNSDKELGLVVDRARELGRRTNVIVASDHGFSLRDYSVNVQQALIGAGLKASANSDDVIVSNTGPALVHVKNRDAAKIRAIAEFLQTQPWAATVYTAAEAPVGGAYVKSPGDDNAATVKPYGFVAGTFSLELIHHSNPERGADVIVTFPWSSQPNAYGVPGRATYAGGGATGPVSGPGSEHGSFSPWDVHNTLLASGPDIKRGVSDVPAGNADITPTVLALAGVPATGEPLDGRVLSEALVNGSPATSFGTRIFRAGPSAVQISSVDGRWYVDKAWSEESTTEPQAPPAAVGQGAVTGSVPATLALTLGGAASFGAFTPGVEKDYTAQATADIVSTAGDAALTVSEPGHLMNGTLALPSPLSVELSKAAWTAPVSHDAVTIAFKQHIGAGDALRTGTYSKTLTFTLSTTTP